MLRAREVRSVSANLLEAMRFFGRARLNGEVLEHPGVCQIFCGLNYAAFNAAVLSGPVGSEAAELRRRIQVPAKLYQARSLRWTCWLCDHDFDSSLRREAPVILRHFGLIPLTAPPGMYADYLAAPRRALPAVDLRPVQDEATRQAFAYITSVGFAIPHSICRDMYCSEHAWSGAFQGYVGYAGGLPVCTAATVISDDLVGIYSVATAPNSRRQGYAEATMRQVLRRSKERTGIEATALQSTDDGFRLYERMGYRKLTSFSVYIS